MSEPQFTKTTEDLYERLPSVYRDEDAKQPVPGTLAGLQAAENLFTNPRFKSTTGTTVVEEGLQGYGGSGVTANAASAVLLDQDYLGTQGYASMTGTEQNYIWTPGSNPTLQLNSDYDIHALIAPTKWVGNSDYMAIVSKYSTPVGNYLFMLHPSGKLITYWNKLSQPNSVNSALSTAVVPAADGQPLWVRTTLKCDNGAGGKDINFYTSTDGVTWTQLGTTVTSTATGTELLATDNTFMQIGGCSASYKFMGRIMRARVYSSINGLKVADFNADDFMDKAVAGMTAVDSLNNTWNITGSLVKMHTRKALWLPGVSGSSGNYVSTPGGVVRGDLDVRVKVSALSFANGGYQTFASHYGSADGQRGWLFRVNSGGALKGDVYSDGTNATGWSFASSVVLAPTDPKAPIWVRMVVDLDNGASGKSAYFYTSTDGINWTQLGATQTAATALTQLFAPPSYDMQFGGWANGAEPLRGTILDGEIRDGIGGTVVSRFRPQEFGAPGVQNFFTDPWLKTGMVGWTTEANATAFAVPNPDWAGNNAIQVTQNATGTASCYKQVSGLTVGKTYTVSVYVKRVAGTSGVTFNFLGVASGVTAYAAAPTTTTRLTATFTATASSGQFYLFNASGAGNGVSGSGMAFLFYGLQVEEGSSASDFNTVNPSIHAANTRYNLIANPRALNNTNGWSNNPGGGTTSLTNSTSGGPTADIQSYARITWTVAATTASSVGIYYNGVGGTPITVVAGRSYNVSWWYRDSTARDHTMYVQFYDASNVNVGNFTENVTAAANIWDFYQRLNIVAPANAVKMYVLTYDRSTGALRAVNDTLDMTGLLVQDATEPFGLYFDGGTTAQTGQLIRWTGAAHASTSQVLDDYTVDSTNLLPTSNAENTSSSWLVNSSVAHARSMDTTVFHSGTQSVKSTLNTGQTNSAILSMYAVGHALNTANCPPVQQGHTYTAGVWFYAGQAGYKGYVSLAWRDASWATWLSQTNGTTVNLAANTWTFITVTAVAPAGAIYGAVGAYVVTQSGASAPAGDWANVDDAVMVEGTTVSYFDGSTATGVGAGFYYRWTGAVSQSFSQRLVRSSRPLQVFRSGDATMELVDRNTFALTGTEYMTFDDRDELDINTQDFVVASGYATRSSGQSCIVGKRSSSFGPGWDLTQQNGTSVALSTVHASTYTLASASVTADGSNHVAIGSRVGSTVSTQADGATAVTATDATAGESLDNSNQLIIGRFTTGSSFKGLIRWVAFFRRALTTVEKTTLSSWNGLIKTEPSWLRAATTLYVNIDDAKSRSEYRTYNRVLNLADTFDGDTPASGDFTYGWSGTAHRSKPQRKGNAITSWSSGVYQAMRNGIPWGAVFGWTTDPWRTPSFAVAPGDTITYSMDLLSDVGDSARIYLSWRDSGGAVVGTSAQSALVTLAPGQEQRVSVTGVAPAGAATVYAYVSRTSARKFKQALFFRRALFVKGAYSGFFFDGSTTYDEVEGNARYGAAWSWSGTPDASTSLQAYRPADPGGFPFKRWLSGITDVAGGIETLVDRIGYDNLSEGGDPDDTSDLANSLVADPAWFRWIAMVRGIRYTPSWTEDQARNILAVEDSYSVGNRDNMINVIESILTGSKSVRLYDHTNDVSTPGGAGVWEMLIVTKTSETPVDVIQTLLDSGVKPAGVKLFHKFYESTWDTIEATYPTWDAWDAAGSWNAIEEAG